MFIKKHNFSSELNKCQCDVSGSGTITSVGEERANSSAVVYLYM